MQINASIPNLIGGVSQQPDVLRSPSQMRELVNASCDPARGLSKRAPTRHLATMPVLFGGGGAYTTLDYEGRGVYHLQITPGATVRMCNDAGEFVGLVDQFGSPVAYSPYLLTDSPTESLKVIKEADTVFLLNTSKVVTETVTPAVTSEWPALVWIKTGAYGRDYTVALFGVGTWTYTTPDGSSAGHINQTKTDVIASNLAAQMTAAGVAGVSVKGSVIALAAGSSFLSVSDSMGDSAIGLVYKSVRTLADLPSRNVPDGFYVKVEGGDGTAAGDYYVQYSAADRVWRETRHPKEAWGTPTPATLPLRLVPVDATTFRLTTPEWAGRKVGDAESNPAPSFVGKPITDLFFYQDRLGIVSGEGVDMSEVGQYFNHYRTTVRDLLDTDPIQVTVSHPKVSALRHAVPFRKRLLLFSEKAQFEVQGGDVLTPKTVAAPAIAEFQAASRVRPVGVGASLYFPADRGAYSAAFNFSLIGQESLEQAQDVSAHVPQYIPKRVTQLQVSPVNNVLFMVSEEEPRYLYVYQFYDNGQERLQSAWHRWDMGPLAVIRAITVVASDLRLIVERTRDGVSQVSSEIIYLSSGQLEPRLDRGYALTFGTVGKVDGVSTAVFAIPYIPDDIPHELVVTSGPRFVGATFPVEISKVGSSYLGTVRRDLSGCDVLFGSRYVMRADLGTFFMREQAGGGMAAVTRGRTQVGRLAVNYNNAALFTVLVDVEGRETVAHKVTNKVLGSGTRGRIGAATLSSGRFTCPALGENTRLKVAIVNDTSSPSSFTSLDWEGQHVSRGRHVG